VPFVVPNLRPVVTRVTVARDVKPGAAGKIVIGFKGKDGNGDSLVYKVEMRGARRVRWIELADDVKGDKYTFDSRTVADGRYEVRVTADDKQSNSPATSLVGTRVSDGFVIDNTAPAMVSMAVVVLGDAATISFKAYDEFTVIGKVSYTVNSNDEWVAVLPDDLIYDTTSEDFTIKVGELEEGEHLISVKISDDVKNTAYSSFEVEVK
jgi:hypothetical protein